MILDDLRLKILKQGGFVNAHAHLDRAYTFDCFTRGRANIISNRKMETC